MLSRLLQPAPVISFTCRPEDFGVIAEPRPAKAHLPDWFRRLPPVDKSQLAASYSGLTVKRCMPFIDAMTTGCILPLAATVRLEIRDGGTDGHRPGGISTATMVSNHGAHQVAGQPGEPRCRPASSTTIGRSARRAGWSCLFVPPLNRADAVFESRRRRGRHRHLCGTRPLALLRDRRRMGSTRSRRARRWCRSSHSAARFGNRG